MEASPQQPVPEAAEKARTIVLVGNDAPMMQRPVFNPETGEQVGTRSEQAQHINQSVTRVEMQPDFDDHEHVKRALSTENDRILSMIARSLAPEHQIYAIGISQFEQFLPIHSGNAKPVWVSSNDQSFAEALGKYYGCDVMPFTEQNGAQLGGPQMLLTNGGRDLIHQNSFTTGSQAAAANYMALTANATAPAATDTTLTAEITTAGGGLVRAQATYAHTAGTNTTTLTKTFTANGSDSLPVTVAKIGIFNASSAGTMTFETLLNSTATLNVSGDNVTVTETITAG